MPKNKRGNYNTTDRARLLINNIHFKINESKISLDLCREKIVLLLVDSQSHINKYSHYLFCLYPVMHSLRNVGQIIPNVV